jgi:hypothetical protein
MANLIDYVHTPHERTKAILGGTVKPTNHLAISKDMLGKGNSWLAIKITNAVGTMWCAYVFAAIAIVGLPAALRPGGEGIIAWIAQTFLQLVLLSIIIVGQNIQSAASDKRAESTYKDAEAVLHEAIEIQSHLAAQDAVLTSLATRLEAMTKS